MAINEEQYFHKLNNTNCSSYTNNHVCSMLYTDILNNISMFTNYNTLFNNFIRNFRLDYYRNRECSHQKKAIELFTTLIDIIDIDKIPNDYFIIMCSQNTGFDEIIKKKLTNMNNITQTIFKNIVSSNNKNLIEFLFESKNLVFEVTSDLLEYVCSNHSINNYVNRHNKMYFEPDNKANSSKFNAKIITELLNHKVTVTKKAILIAILNTVSIEIIKQLIMLGPEICTDYLEAACFSVNTEVTDFLLDNKIIPTNECFKQLFSKSNNKYEELYSDKCGKRIPYSIRDGSLIKEYTSMVTKLINYNYTVTYKDVLMATEFYVTIPNIEKYNIKFDSKFLDICSEASFYPNYKHNIVPDVSCLQRECKKSGNITAIRELINKQKIKPDAICLENACNLRSNMATIKVLIEKGAPVSIKAVKNIVDANANSVCSYVVDEYIKNIQNAPVQITAIKTQEPVKKIEVVSESESDEQELSEVSSLSNEADNIDILGVSANTQNVQQVPIDEEESSESDEEEEVEVKEVKTTKKYKGAKIVVKKKQKDEAKIEVAEEKQVKQLVDCITVPTKILDKDKVVLSDTFCKFFSIENNTEMNVISMKRFLLNYFNNKKLLKKDSFVIELSDDICKAIGLDTTKYLSKLDIKELDKFCKYILENMQNKVIEKKN